MSEKCQVGAVNDLGGIREAVCIHTKKICDSCIDKDCIEDLRVFLTQDSQAILEQATNVKARSAELLYVSLDVEPAQFNTGHYTVDITYYYRILVDAIVCGTRPCTICGLSVFSKRVILCGGEGSARTFSSKAVMDGFDRQRLMQTATPQDLVSMIVAKAVNMARMMEIPVLGFVENYSYYQCPDCGKKTKVFGKSHLDAMSQQYNIPILARLPIDPTVAQMADMGCIEQVDLTAIEPAAQALTKE